MASDAELKPTATGSFATKPFAHILVFLFDKKMTGTLDITHGDHMVTLYFRNGAPTKARTSLGNRSLGQVMLDLGLITPDQLKTCKATIAKSGGLQGQTLVDLGAIGVQTLVRGLKEQMLLKLTDVFSMTDGLYTFYENVNKLSGFGPDEVFPIHPYPVLMAGYRIHGATLDTASLLGSMTGKWVAIGGAPEDVRLFRLNREEKAIVGALLAGARSFGELTEGGLYDPRVARYVLYVLLITRRLVITNESPEVPSDDLPPSLSSTPPPARKTMDPILEALRDGIMEKAKALTGQSYYEMLDLGTDASIEDARRAFFRLSKKFHPDRLSPALRDELRDTAEYIFSNLKEAHNVLTDPPSREAYDRAISGGPERSFSARLRDESEVRDALEAESLFQRAVVFLKQNRLDECAELLDQARALNPGEGEYLALETHLKVLARPTNANFDDLLDKLRRAAGERPNSEQVNFFLASALKRAGKFNEAQTYFVRVLEINEHNIEAARELRFLKRRKADSLAGKRQSSLFKRIFK